MKISVPAAPRPLTKSEFMDFRECEKSFWLQRNKPALAGDRTPGEFDRLLMQDGYAVEALAGALFAAREDAGRFTMQAEISCGRCLIRTDFIFRNADGSIDIYEVKSSTSPDEHIADACFQKLVAHWAGFVVGAVHVVHLNPHYRRCGDIDPTELLIVAEVTDAVAAIAPEIERDIERALLLLDQPAIDEAGCACILKSRARHCPSFRHFHPDLPERPVHILPRMQGARLANILASGRRSVTELTSADVTPSQLPVLNAMLADRPLIDIKALSRFLAGLTFPLHFYDYETAGSAIPSAEGHGPHEQIPVQFSVHILEEDGQLRHHEFLADDHGSEEVLINALQSALGATGTALAWNESFEKGCNRRLARLAPSHAEFLADVTERTTDLMAPFRRDYVHPDFDGSTSIKKVLPVLVPSLSYEGMAVHDGAGAILAFRKMVAEKPGEARAALRRQLLAYCRLDTLAMVEIYRHLVDTVLEPGNLKHSRASVS